MTDVIRDLPRGDRPRERMMMHGAGTLSDAELLAAAATFYKRMGSEVEAEERSMFTGLYVLGANILAVTLLSLDANDYFKQLRERATGAGRPGGSRQIDGAHQLTLSALWSIYGATALIVGVMRGLKPLRVAAAVLLGVTTFKVLVIDLAYYNAPWHTAIFNETFAAFALLISANAVTSTLNTPHDS